MNKSNSDVAMYFVAKLGPALQGFLSIFLITRSLSPENYGKYSLAVTLILLVTQLLGSWLNQAQFFFLPKRRMQGNRMAAWFDRINLYIGIVGSIAVAATLHIFQVGTNAALIGGAVFFVQICWNYMSTYHQSLEQPKVQLVASTYQVASQIIFITVLFCYQKITVASALLAIFVGFSVGLLSYRQRNFLKIGGAGFAKGKNFFRYLQLAISYGGPFSLWFMFCQIYTFSDRFFLSSAGLAADVGRYSAARDLLLGITSVLAMPLLMVAHPMIIRIWTDRKDAAEIQEIINRNLTIIYIVGVFFCTVLFGYGEAIFSRFFSSKYQLHDFQYAATACAVFFSVASMYAHKALEVTGRTVRMAMIGGGVAAFSVLTNMIASTRFGLSAVILVNLLSQAAYFSVAAWMSKTLWRVFVAWDRVLLVAIAAAAVYSVGKLFDLFLPAPICQLIPLPWGCFAVIILSTISVLAFPEVNGMFRGVRAPRMQPNI